MKAMKKADNFQFIIITFFFGKSRPCFIPKLRDRCLQEKKMEIKAAAIIHPSNTCGEAEAIP